MDGKQVWPNSVGWAIDEVFPTGMAQQAEAFTVETNAREVTVTICMERAEHSIGGGVCIMKKMRWREGFERLKNQKSGNDEQRNRR